MLRVWVLKRSSRCVPAVMVPSSISQAFAAKVSVVMRGLAASIAMVMSGLPVLAVPDWVARSVTPE